MEAHNSLIFISDISGFTKFVDSTASEHSQHIIAELLEILIDSQELDMTLAEIEGDALFYYKEKDLPSPREIMAQVEKMFINFHKHLQQYEFNRICECGACSAAAELTVKFIVHSGNLDFIQIKKDIKPYGRDVILAHRLMKNDIPLDDYLLISQNVLEGWGNPTIPLPEGLSSENGHTTYDLGVVPYTYVQLTPLRQQIERPSPSQSFSAGDYLLEVADNIEASPDDLFEIVSNLDYRAKINDGADEIIYDKNKVNRAGTKHLCIIHGRQLEFETVKGDFGKDKLVIGEHTNDIPVIGEMTTYFIIEPHENGSRVSIQAYSPHQSLFKRIVLKLMKKMIAKPIERTIQNIKTLVKKKNAAAKITAMKWRKDEVIG